MGAVAGLRAMIMDILRSEAGSTLSHASESAMPLYRAMGQNRRLVPDFLDVRSARNNPESADFYLRRRGQEASVGSPMPRSSLDAWRDIQDHNSSNYTIPNNASFNPEHHWAVRVRDPNRMSPELAYKMVEALYNAQRNQFRSRSHGTTSLVNLTLRDIRDLYGHAIPPPQMRRAFRAHLQDAAGSGFADLDTRPPLIAGDG